MNLLSPSVVDASAFAKHWIWFCVWGILFMILGALAIGYATLTTFLSVIFIGFLIATSGAVIIIDSFTFWWQKWRGFFLHIMMGILYLVVGLTLVSSPIWGSISLTLLLAIFYIVIGIFRIVYSKSVTQPRFGWNLFSGIVALLLGILILVQWPESSLFIIGLFVGIDLLIFGWAYVMAALTARTMVVK